VVGGGRLSDVFERHRYLFPELQIAMLRAAEHGGMLEDTLKRLAEYLEKELALRRMISRLTLYPKLVLLSALFILGRSFFTDGIPAVSKLIVGSMGKAAYGGWDYFLDTAFVLLVLGAGTVATIAVARTALFRSPVAREVWERLKLSVPGVGGVVRSFAATRFGRAFGAMYGAGVSLGAAVRVAGVASGSGLIAASVERAMDRVERGEPLSRALSSAGVFPALVLDMLRTGEQTGNLDTMMSKAADHLEGEAETRAHMYSHIFATAVYLLVAILVAFAVVRFWASYAGGFG
jgi:type II secretory pathway component PulF